MSNKFINIDIKNLMHYSFNDIINIKSFNPSKIKIDKKSYKNILIYYIWYMTNKDSKCMKINSVNVCILLSTKLIDRLKKLIKISIWR